MHLNNMQSIQEQFLNDHDISLVWNKYRHDYGETYYQMIQQGKITIGEKVLKITYFTRGSRPLNGYSLVFGLHGGGGCPSQVNDQQYQNHMHLYDAYLPQGIIWIVMRSC